MTISRHTIARASAVTLAALALAACGESTAPLNVSPAQLESMGDAVAVEIESSVRQLTAQDVMNTTAGAPTFSRGPVSSPTMARGLSFNRWGTSASAASAASGSSTTLTCGVPSQDPPVDTDGDNVPDNFSVTFALPACHFEQQGSAFDITGVLRVSDPQPAVAGLALNYALDNFRIDFAGSQGSGSVRRNGSASVSASSSGLSQTMDWTESASFTGVPSVSATIGWTASFVAAQGQTIAPGQPLPDGAYQANGTVGYREGNRVATFSVTTITPLQYSAACVAGMEQGTAYSPFSAGRVRVTVSGQQGSGSVDVTYTSCNSAIVVLGP